MSVVFDRPYEFVQRDRSKFWPWLIQRLRLVDLYLKKKEGVVARQVIDFDRLRSSVDQGHGVVVAPNHCRYSDPLVMAWPSRDAAVYFYAVASWHLFNKSWFDRFGMKRCGAFSLHREGTDRRSLETAIEILTSAERPLIIFPEGQTYRTNDLVRPSLEGVGFIARSAARKRAKINGGQIVVHPVAIKYLANGDITPWANHQLDQMESHLGWRHHRKPDLIHRVMRLSNAQLTLNEIAHLGAPQTCDDDQRRKTLCEHLLCDAENQLAIQVGDPTDIRMRIRTIRSSIVAEFFGQPITQDRQRQLKDLDDACEIAHQLHAYHDQHYLNRNEVTSERIVETIQRIQESLMGKINRRVPLKAIIQCGEAIDVPAEKAPKNQSDPLLVAITDQTQRMIDQHPGHAIDDH